MIEGEVVEIEIDRPVSGTAAKTVSFALHVGQRTWHQCRRWWSCVQHAMLVHLRTCAAAQIMSSAMADCLCWCTAGQADAEDDRDGDHLRPGQQND